MGARTVYPCGPGKNGDAWWPRIAVEQQLREVPDEATRRGSLVVFLGDPGDLRYAQRMATGVVLVR